MKSPSNAAGKAGGRVFSRALAVVTAVAVSVGVAVVPAQAQDEASSEMLTPQNLPAVEEQAAESFIVTWNSTMAGHSDEVAQQTLNKILKNFSTESGLDITGSKTDVAFDGSWIVSLTPEVPANLVPKLKGMLEAEARINEANINAKLYPFTAPNDPEYRKQWPFFAEHGANVEKAWDLGFLGQGVTIGVVDSGIIKHPEMPYPTKLVGGVDMIRDGFISQDGDNVRDADFIDEGDWYNDNECQAGMPGAPSVWHGTHVSGIASATTNNGEGVAGTAPEAHLTMARALGRCGGTIADIADAIAWSAGVPVDGVPANPNPAQVINLSLGGKAEVCQPLYQRAITAANQRGATILVAAGNDNNPTYNITPANCNGVITIGATGPEGHRAVYSNYGPEVDLGAPGGNGAGYSGNRIVWDTTHQFYSTVDVGRTSRVAPGYTYMEGTSMATPLVAGVVAMMKSANPGLITPQIKDILQKTASPYTREPSIRHEAFVDDGIAYDPSRTATGMGAGIVNAFDAVCESAKLAGNTPKECGDETPSTQPSTPATAPTVTTTVTTTKTLPPVTETKTQTSTVRTTVKEPAEKVTLTETVTKTEAPTTVTTTLPQATATVTTTTTLPRDTATVTATQTEPGTTLTVTETKTQEPATVTETTTETSVVDKSGEPVTVVETTTATVTEKVDVPVTTTVTKAPSDDAASSAPRKTISASISPWPLLLMIPVGIAALLHMPGMDAFRLSLSSNIRDINTDIQKGLRIISPDIAKRINELLGQIRPNADQSVMGSSLINAGLLSSATRVDYHEE